MANNIQDSSLGQHMDKIAYAAAGIIGVVFLLMAVIAGRPLQRLDSQLEAAYDDVKDREAQTVEVEPVPDVAAQIQAQWQVEPAAASYPAWTAERVPSLAQWAKEKEGVLAQHEPPQVTRVSYHRHDETFQVYLKVEGKFGQISSCEFDSVQLFRKTADGGYKQLLKFDGAEALKTGQIVYLDPEVEAGEVYSYKIRTSVDVVQSGEAPIILGEEVATQESPEATIAPIPYDFSVRVQIATPFNPAAPEGQKYGRFLGEILVAPSEFGAEPTEVEAPASAAGQFPEGFRFGPRIETRRGKVQAFEVTLVEQSAVIVKNWRANSRETFKTQEAHRPIALPPPHEFAPPAPGTEDAEVAADGADDASDEAAATDDGGSATSPEPSDVAGEPAEEEEEPEKKGPSGLKGGLR